MVDPKKKQTPAVPPRIEVTIVAEYDDPWPNERSEVAGMRNAAWEPSNVTFRQMAQFHRLPFFDCSDVDTFMGAILKAADGTVARVNLITHGNPGAASLGGYIELDAPQTSVTNIWLGALNATERMQNRPAPTDPARTQDWLSYRMLDVSVMNWLNDSGGVGPQYRDMLRKKFRDDAEFIIYACHAGMGASMLFLMDIATTLIVTARGFQDPIRYDPTFEPAQPTKGKPDKVVNRRQTHYQNGPVQEGFKHLVPDKVMPRPKTP